MEKGRSSGAGITVFLADDNLLVRVGRAGAAPTPARPRASSARPPTTTSLVAGAEAANPDVIVTDIRMPPTFQREGIEAAKEVRKRHPGTGVVVLSQFDDPEYAVALLAEGSAGYGYLLKDRLAEGDELVDAIRAVATGGTALDPVIVEALVRPGRRAATSARPRRSSSPTSPPGGRSRRSPPLGRCRRRRSATPSRSCSSSWPRGPRPAARRHCAGCACSTRRSSTARSRARRCRRLLPGGLAEKLRTEGRRIGETEPVEVTVLMSDIRGYSGIAEKADPSDLARQLNEHRAAMNEAVLSNGGTVMQFVGDAVMAVFGAPFPQADHAARGVAAALAMHEAQRAVNDDWAASRPAAVRARHRPVERGRRRRPPRLGGAARVHDRRRHGEPVAAVAGPRPPRRPHRAEPGHLGPALRPPCRRHRPSTPRS